MGLARRYPSAPARTRIRPAGGEERGRPTLLADKLEPQASHGSQRVGAPSQAGPDAPFTRSSLTRFAKPAGSFSFDPSARTASSNRSLPYDSTRGSSGLFSKSARMASTAGCDPFSSRIRFDSFTSAPAPAFRRRRSRLAPISPSSATRQEALSVRRRESRTSFTSEIL